MQSSLGHHTDLLHSISTVHPAHPQLAVEIPKALAIQAMMQLQRAQPGNRSGIAIERHAELMGRARGGRSLGLNGAIAGDAMLAQIEQLAQTQGPATEVSAGAQQNSGAAYLVVASRAHHVVVTVVGRAAVVEIFPVTVTT